jgi:4-hydroxysphinganine ceramide fatty acyl 2-hydroxylase
MKQYVSNKQETPRMFRSNFMEFFSRVHWTVPLWTYIPVIAVFLYVATVSYGLPPLTAFVFFTLGIFVWSFTEYMLHRFVFHYEPSTEWGRKIHWTFHGVHHDYPSDPLRLVMPPAVSFPLATLFYFLFYLALGHARVAAFMPGFILGYLFYDISHYAVHHFPIKGAVFGRLREHHMRHHFQSPDRGFGVSSALWDFVFRTGYGKKEEPGTVTISSD